MLRHFIRLAAFSAALLSLTTRAAPPPVAEPHVWLHGVDAIGRPFDLERLRGQVVIIAVASRATADEAKTIGARLSSVAALGTAAVVTVVNLDEVPFFALGYARSRVAKEAARSPMVILTDDHGALCRALAVQGSDILVIDQHGQLHRRYRGAGQIDEALRTVDELRRQLVVIAPMSGR